MTPFRVFETNGFVEQLGRLAESGRGAIESKLKRQVYPQLRQSPFFGVHIRKLRNYQPPTWRYRIGDYRLFFSIDSVKKVVSILAIDHRKDAYQ